MSDETPGAGQGALPPREGQSGPRTVAERPTVRLTHVGGQYVLTAQPHGVPALAQITPGTPLSATRIISISPSRVSQTSPLPPSVANQSIVNVLKSGPASNIRLQLFSSDSNAQQRSLKRPLSQPERKDTYAAKLERVMNHRIVRSKLVKEKYSEHLLEAFYLETGGNILDLYQYAKRPKSQAYLAYLREHAIDPREHAEDSSSFIPETTPTTPTATSVSSLPGISHSYTTTTNPSSSSETPKTASVKNKTPSFTPASNQEQIVEKAKQEAYVVQRIADLQKEGLWSERRLPKVQDMQRSKAHWDFLLEEMVWLAADFAQERKWKKAAAKKCARMVQKYFQDKAMAAQRAEKAQEQNLRRIASFCAKEIKNFWNNVEKLVEYKQNTILEEKRKKALDQQLSFIVDQTEKYSQLLAEGMNKTSNEVPSSTKSSRSASRVQSDDEFEPVQSDEDDEETIAQEEAIVESAEQTEEIAALQRESQMELDDLLEDDLLREYLLNRDNIKMSESDDSDSDSDKKRTTKKTTVVEEESEDSESEDDDEEDEESEDDTEMTETEKKDHGELKILVEDNNEGESTKTDKNDDLLNDAAAIAESIQPKGNTLSSTSVSTKVPFLLKFTLREYQHIGLDWLVTMFERKLNGILADEMGLGKTIQTIALLSHLACEKENWGPHLIVVPTSVMLNWEMECKKWCPAFKILTYYGTQKERKLKRTGWTKPNAFHICITSYKLVIQDHQSFRRKKWKYLILDEAQNIKNFKSQRWQLLLNFQTQQRLLLTGTPLQNNLMELWSLMHFLMPNVFQSHREFKEWFSNPVTGMIEGNSEYNESIIKRLHKVLRPFLLRRLKSEVEKQMPKKYEHVVMCRLSKRQRYLYDDYMSRAKTRETLASGNLLSVINVLMQLRKVCNHPNLFEVRPTISSFQSDSITLHIPSIVYSAIDYDVWKNVNLHSMNLLLILFELNLSAYQCYRMREMRTPKRVLENHTGQIHPRIPPTKLNMRVVKVSDEKGANKGVPQGVKVKVGPQYGVQLVSQQGVVKAIPVVNISQSASGSQGQSPVLKPADKINASFAQLVQTSTGKHLLLTSNPNITGNIPVTTTTPGGQKLTLLSKQAVSTTGNAGHQITKAFVKFQITSVTTATTTTTVTTTGSNAIQNKDESKDDSTLKTVGAKFIEQLYANQNNLDVRWGSEEKMICLPGEEDPKAERRKRYELMARINEWRCTALPLYGRDFQESIKIFNPCTENSWVGGRIHCLNTLFNEKSLETTDCLKNMLFNPEQRIEQLKHTCDRFIFYVPAVKSSEPELQVWHPSPSKYWGLKEEKLLIQRIFSKPATSLHHIASAMVTQFPDPRLIQYDCGKLQTLDRLLRQLKQGGHRVLIFTQMTKMLDVLEAFLNFHGHIYLRLDGSTKVDQRQVLMERFNGDKRIFAFILSTRSGGVGVNLTGADTVIFYDSDWNPTMDAQAQDRCHRIGQNRDVHIYRLVSERTIEENILKKANQKRLLGDLAIEGGNFTTAYFKSSTIQDLFNIDQNEESAANRMSEVVESSKEREKKLAIEPAPPGGEDKVAMGALENALAACEDDQDVQAARTAKAEAVADLAEFDENIPLDEPDKEKEPEMSKAEQEIDNVIKKLSPIERYAMRFIEETESAWSAEQLAAAARLIEDQKREWEQNRLAAMKEEEERRTRELEEEADMITFSREDATNQVSTKSKKFKSKKVLNKTLPTPKLKKRRVVRTRSVSESKSKCGKRLRSTRLASKVVSDVDDDESNDDDNDNDSVVSHDDDDDDNVAEDNSDDVVEGNDDNNDTDDVTDRKVNGETDSNSMDSVVSESDLTLAVLKGSSNHVDHNSPRTRSRGTVAINLWTLDVSPILPGVKPVKKHRVNNDRKKSEGSSESESEEEKTPKQTEKRKFVNELDGEKSVKVSGKRKHDKKSDSESEEIKGGKQLSKRKQGRKAEEKSDSESEEDKTPKQTGKRKQKKSEGENNDETEEVKQPGKKKLNKNDSESEGDKISKPTVKRKALHNENTDELDEVKSVKQSGKSKTNKKTDSEDRDSEEVNEKNEGTDDEKTVKQSVKRKYVKKTENEDGNSNEEKPKPFEKRRSTRKIDKHVIEVSSDSDDDKTVEETGKGKQNRKTESENADDNKKSDSESVEEKTPKRQQSGKRKHNKKSDSESEEEKSVKLIKKVGQLESVDKTPKQTGKRQQKVNEHNKKTETENTEELESNDDKTSKQTGKRKQKIIEHNEDANNDESNEVKSGKRQHGKKSDSESEDDKIPKQTGKRKLKINELNKKTEEENNDDSNEDKSVKQSGKRKHNKKSDSESEEEKTPKQTGKRKQKLIEHKEDENNELSGKRKHGKKTDSESEEDKSVKLSKRVNQSESVDKTPKQTGKRQQKINEHNKKTETENTEELEPNDDKTSKQIKRKPLQNKKSEDENTDESDEEKPVKQPSKRKPNKKTDNEDQNSVDSEEPSDKRKHNKKTDKQVIEVSSDSDDEKTTRQSGRRKNNKTTEEKAVKRNKPVDDLKTDKHKINTEQQTVSEEQTDKTKNNAIKKGKICTIILNDIMADGQYKIPASDSSSTQDTTKTKDFNDVISIDLTESDDEIIKENIESSNIPNDSNGLDDIKPQNKNAKRLNLSFKSPECRKSYKKFNKTTNKTLDCWVTRSPKSNLEQDEDEAKTSKRD